MFHAVYDVLHENMGQVKGPTQIAKELGLETPGSEEILKIFPFMKISDLLSPLIWGVNARQVKTMLSICLIKAFGHKPLIY